MEKNVEFEEKKNSKFQWFLVIIVIPLLFTIAIALIILTVVGVNVFDLSKDIGNKIPFVSEMINQDEKKAESVEGFQKNIVELEAEIQDREAEVAKLESIIDGRDKELQTAQLEKQNLETEIQELMAVKDENKRAFKDIIKTYETMSAKKSAPIIVKLGDDEAVKILSSIKANTLASILEQMAPDDAARLTKKLTIQASQDNEANE